MNNKTLQFNTWQKIAKHKWTDNAKDFEVSGLPYKGTFKNNSLDGFSYERAGKKITLKPTSIGFDGKTLQAKSSNGSRKDNKVSYKGVFGNGIDIEMEADKMRWKKQIKINSLDDLDIPDGAEFLEIKFELETTFDIEGWDKNSELEFTKAIKLGKDSQIESIKSWDSSPEVLDKDGNSIDKQQTHIGVLSKENDKLFLTKKIPVDWLQTAIFPIWTDVEITYGTTYPFNEASTNYTSVALLDSTHFVVAYADNGGDDYGIAMIGVVSDTNVITFGSEYTFYDTGAIAYVVASALDSTHFVVAFKQTASPYYGKSIIGTVSSGDEIAYGSIYNFNAANCSFLSISALDSTHFVIVYKDEVDTYGKGIIGTVSSVDEIAYGSIYTFNSGRTQELTVSALDATHFVVTYKDFTNSYYGTAQIGVVSSVDEISYGSQYVYKEFSTNVNECLKVDATHFVVIFSNYIESVWGAYAIIGTVSSGDEIAYGSIYNFNAAQIGYVGSSLLDSTHFVVSFWDSGNSSYGTTKVGTISSGDEIAFGSSAVYNQAASAYNSVVAIDSTHFVVTYKDDGGDDYGEAVIGTYTPSTTDIKSINGLAYASVKSKNGLAIADIKNINGLA